MSFYFNNASHKLTTIAEIIAKCSLSSQQLIKYIAKSQRNSTSERDAEAEREKITLKMWSFKIGMECCRWQTANSLYNFTSRVFGAFHVYHPHFFFISNTVFFTQFKWNSPEGGTFSGLEICSNFFSELFSVNIVLHKWPSLAFQRYEIEHSKRNSQWEKNCDSHSLLNFVDSMTQHKKMPKV